MNLVLVTSGRSRSGYKHVIYDSRAKNKPWSVSHKPYRSRGFATAKEAAIHQALRLQRQPDGGKRQIPKKAAPLPVKKAGPVVDALVPDAAAAVSATPAPADWMRRVRFDGAACDSFGARILMKPSKREAPLLAVIKSWLPCSPAPFGVVFDHKPNLVYQEDLLRKGREDWTPVDWEGDIWETLELRPMCPKCGHPLDVGRNAWTRCTGCGEMEPGAAAVDMHTRKRSDDPYRRKAISYAED